MKPGVMKSWMHSENKDKAEKLTNHFRKLLTVTRTKTRTPYNKISMCPTSTPGSPTEFCFKPKTKRCRSKRSNPPAHHRISLQSIFLPSMIIHSHTADFSPVEGLVKSNNELIQKNEWRKNTIQQQHEHRHLDFTSSLLFSTLPTSAGGSSSSHTHTAVFGLFSFDMTISSSGLVQLKKELKHKELTN